MDTLFALLATLQLVCSSPLPSQYHRYQIATVNQILHPVSLDQVNGTVTNASSLASNALGNAIFTGPSSATYDFGRNITGNVTLTVGDVDADQYIGIRLPAGNATTTSSDGCSEVTATGTNETFWFFPTGPGNFTVPHQHERGSFQYLSLLHNTTGGIQVQQITVQ